MSMEEGLFPKDHTCKHASETPHIKGVVVHLQIIKHYLHWQYGNALLCTQANTAQPLLRANDSNPPIILEYFRGFPFTPNQTLLFIF